jgi:hypothetical protein
MNDRTKEQRCPHGVRHPHPCRLCEDAPLRSNERLIQALRGFAQHSSLCQRELSEPSEEGTQAILSPCTCGLDQLLDATRPAHETSRDETGWLIEVELGGRPHYWKASADARCIGEFDPDVNAALRLSREKDARDLALFLSAKGTIALSDVRKIKITEHAWPCSSVEPTPGTVDDVMCPHGYNRLAMKADGTRCAECPPENGT